MKHCIIITTSYPRSSSGARPGSEAAGSFVRDFSQGLSRYCTVTVLAPGRGRTGFRDGNVGVHTYWAPDGPLSDLRIWRMRDLWAILRVFSSGYRAAGLLAKQHREASLIFALWALPSGAWAKRLAARLNARYAVWVLGSDIWSLSKIPVVKNVLRHILSGSHINFADGYLLADDVRRLTKKNCEYLASTRNIQPPPLKNNPSRPYTLGYLGRWHPNKGVDLLLDALAKLETRDWQNIRNVKIAGGGELHSLVMSRVEQLRERGLPIEVAGYLGKAEAVDFLSSLDILMIPSRVESVPVVLTDAVKCRCAIVSTPVGDVAMLNEAYRFGVVADAVTSDAFAEKLAEIVREDLGRFLSNTGKLMELFSIDHTVNAFVEKAVR